MTDETVAESYDRIKRELRERVIQDTLAMERRIREAVERERAKQATVPRRSWWERLRDWMRSGSDVR